MNVLTQNKKASVQSVNVPLMDAGRCMWITTK